MNLGGAGRGRVAIGACAGVVCMLLPGVANATGSYTGSPTSASVAETVSPSGWYQTDAVHLTLTATDTDAGVKAIGVKDDSTNPGFCIAPSSGTGTVTPYPTTMSETITVRGAADCPVEFWAVDGNGNTETHHTIGLKIDNSPPHIEISTGPITGTDTSTWSDSPVWIGSISCDDNYLYGPPSYPLQSGCAGPPSYSVDGATSVPFSSGFYLREGRHDLAMVASDNAGNQAQLDRHYFVDLTAPSVTFESPPEGLVIGPALLSARASDPNLADGTPGSGVHTVTFFVSNVANQTQGPNAYPGNETISDTWTATADLPTGVYQVITEGMDLAGNTTYTSQTIITVVSPPGT